MRKLHLTRVDGEVVRVTVEQEVGPPGMMIFFGDGTPLGVTAGPLVMETEVWTKFIGVSPDWEGYRNEPAWRRSKI